MGPVHTQDNRPGCFDAESEHAAKQRGSIYIIVGVSHTRRTPGGSQVDPKFELRNI